MILTVSLFMLELVAYSIIIGGSDEVLCLEQHSTKMVRGGSKLQVRLYRIVTCEKIMQLFFGNWQF